MKRRRPAGDLIVSEAGVGSAGRDEFDRNRCGGDGGEARHAWPADDAGGASSAVGAGVSGQRADDGGVRAAGADQLCDVRRLGGEGLAGAECPIAAQVCRACAAVRPAAGVAGRGAGGAVGRRDRAARQPRGRRGGAGPGLARLTCSRSRRRSGSFWPCGPWICASPSTDCGPRSRSIWPRIPGAGRCFASPTRIAHA